MKNNRLIAITIIRNEEHNFLSSWLDNVRKIVDYHIFVDDASDDKTPQIIAEHLKKYPGELHIRKTSLFRQNEPALRDELWKYTRHIAHDGDWILIVDADEFYDGHLLRLKKKLLDNKFPNAEVVKVSCLDMWTTSSYRVDGYWSPLHSDVRLIRYHNVDFNAQKDQLHQPPYPSTTNTKKKLSCFIPKIHLAYLREQDRERRYEFYSKNVSAQKDPISYKHVLSIKSDSIRLKSFFNKMNSILAFIKNDQLYFEIKQIIRKIK